MAETGLVHRGGLVFSGLVSRGVMMLMTTRSGGASEGPFTSLNTSRSVGDLDEYVLANRLAVLRALGIPYTGLALTGQVHGTTIARINHGGPVMGVGCEADGMVTAPNGPALAISIADCLAVLVHDTRTGARGAAHAGWRGTFGRITVSLIDTMAAEFGTRPEDCKAYLSPCIGPCCYRVPDSVCHPLKEAPGAARYLFTRQGAEWRLDLRAENRAQLFEAGVPPTYIVDDALCTSCRADLFFSHVRDEGRTGRMWAIIGREKHHG